MQAVEALTRLIDIADAMADAEDAEKAEQDQLAISICQAMLNTALPVARFRCFVQVESGKHLGREYTLCGVKIEDIVAGLTPLSRAGTKVYVTLWEQRATGADMIEGYQGMSTRKPGSTNNPFIGFLKSLSKYSEPEAKAE